ncbi:MAG TPA: ABC transporter substrate-binding protein [Chloroflexota bacterium]|nr:ABC transporter substrate-binding protein [Chloroflexota bacterium]
MKKAAQWLGLVVCTLLAACAPATAPGAVAPSTGPANAPPAPPVGAPSTSPAAAAASEPPLITTEIAIPSLDAFAWPFVVVRDGPIGTQQRLNLDWTVVDTDARSMQALLGGSADFALLSLDALARAVDQGADVVAIGGHINRPTYGIAARPELTSIEDIRGKTVAVSDLRGGSTVILKLLLQAKGVKEDEYELLPLGGTMNRFTGLATGVADAAILGQPADFRARDEGYGILAYSTDLDYQFTVYAMRRSWADSNRAKIARFLQAMVAAHRWLHDPANREQAVDLGVTVLHSSPVEMERTWDLYFQQNAGRVMPRDLEVNRPGITTVARTLAEAGEIRDAGEVERFVDDSYLQEVLHGR